MDIRLYTGVAWEERAARLFPIPIITTYFSYDWGKIERPKS